MKQHGIGAGQILDPVDGAFEGDGPFSKWSGATELEHAGVSRSRTQVQDRREALFDLEADPVETENLIDDPAYAERVETFRERRGHARLRAERRPGERERELRRGPRAELI
jgi:hypothetical protein